MSQRFASPASLARAATIGSEVRCLLSLGVPAAGTQLAFMLLGVVDTAMLGHFDAGALAAAGIGNMWHWAVTSFFFGVVLGTEAIISQGFGRGDARAVALGLQRGVLIALLSCVPGGVIQALAEPALLALGQESSVAADAGLYCILRLPSIPGFLLYIALRTYMQGRGIVWPAFWVSVLANVVNAALNWVLIFGNAGAPELGLAGAALATSITSLMLPLGLFLWMKKERLFDGYVRPWDAESVSLAGLGQVWKLGLPIGLQTALEGWAFAAASGIAGWISVTALASYQITLNVAALFFMVPLGLSIGAAARVGNLIGAGHWSDARRSMAVAFSVGALWSIVSGGSLLALGSLVPALFTRDAEVTAAVLLSLPAVAGFQFFDATQALGGALLRAMGRPRAGAVINVVGFFAVALPLAHYWAVKNNGGVQALWYSLAIGLALVAIGVSVWVLVLSRKPVEELQVGSS
jgi:MATE family multidrug resistance protein